MFVTGKPVPNAHAAIRLFALCAAMKWAHLPVAGGIYDQHPDLLEKFRYIFERQGIEQQREVERQKAEQKRNLGSSRRRAGGARSR